MVSACRADASKQARTKSGGLTIVIKLGAPSSLSLELFTRYTPPHCIFSSSPYLISPLTSCPISRSFSSTSTTPVHKLTHFLLGTSSIVSPSYPFLPHLQLLSSIVETVVHLRQQGHRVVLCSSGAIGVGLRRMGKRDRGKGLHQKQVSGTRGMDGREISTPGLEQSCCGNLRSFTAWKTPKSLVVRLTMTGARGNWAGQTHRAVGQPLLSTRSAHRPDPTHENGHLRCKWSGHSTSVAPSPCRELGY